MNTIWVIIHIFSYLVVLYVGYLIGWVRGWKKSLDESGIIHGRDAEKFRKENNL